MKRTAVALLLVLFAAMTFSASAQPVKMHGMWWNPTWLHGKQQLDVDGNGADDWFNDTGTPIWWADGTPRYRAVRVWTGAFDQFTMVNGVKTPVNPDGNPMAMVNYNMPYGGGNMWDQGSWHWTYGSFARGGSKQEYFYVSWRGFWRADRQTKDPVSATNPVIINFDLEQDTHISDVMVTNWNNSGQPGSAYFWSAAKDVTIKYKKEADSAWTTLGTFQLDYAAPNNTNAYGTYRPVNFVGDTFTNLNGGTSKLNGVPDPHPLNIDCRYMQWVISSNWGQGIDPTNVESKLVGINQVSLYKDGAYLAFYSELMEGYGVGSYYVASETTMTVGYGKVEIGSPAHQDLQLWNMGGYDEALSEIQITGIEPDPNGNFVVEYKGAPVTEETFPISIFGNKQDRLDVIYDPKAFGEHTGSIVIHYKHMVQGPEYDKNEFIQPFKFLGTAVNPAFGFVPIAGIYGYPAGYGGFSDYFYLVRPSGAIREVPALGWLWGTRQAWLSSARGYLAQSLLQIDNSYYMFDFGKEYGAGTENGPIDELWGWTSWWYGGGPALKNVKIYVSNDDTAWSYRPRIGPSTTDPSLVDKFDVNAGDWTFVRDAQFSNQHGFGWVPGSNSTNPGERRPLKGTVIPLASAPGPYRYMLLLVNGGAGEGNWGDGSQLSFGAMRFFQKGPDMLVYPDGYNFGELNVYSTSSTQFVIGNVGTPEASGANDLTIQSIEFSTDRGWNGGGAFSLPDVGDLGLPKLYAPGTTETFTVEAFPTDFGIHKARVIVTGVDKASRINAWEFELQAKVVEYATGYIRGVKATANAQYDAGAWAAQAAVNSYGIQEPDGLNWDVSTHIGSKQAKHWYGGWAWLMGATQRISEAWIECDLGGVYALDQMWLWNASWNDMNQFYGPESAIKTTYIEYREDQGDSWKQLGGDDMFYTFFGLGDRMWATNPYPATNLVDGDADETNNPPVTFGGVRARYVRVSTAGGHDVGSWGDSIFAICVAEMRFYSQPSGLTVSPSILNFGSKAIGDPRTLTFDIENDGGSPVTIDMVVALGLNTPYVVTDPTGPVTIAAGSARTVQIQFAPTEVGAYNNYKIGIISQLGVMYVQVNGSSFVAGTPDLALSKTRLPFGTVYLPIGGGAPDPMVLPVDISNHGDVPLAVSSIATSNLTFPAGSDMAFTADKANATVAAQASPTAPGMTTMNVSFTPLVAGNYTGQVVLTSNDPDESPTTVTLTGNAVVTQPAGVETQDWMLY